MKSMHNRLRALNQALGLALLLATATAAMIGAFSGPVPTPGLPRPAALAPVTEPAGQPLNSDTLMYQRVALSDGSQHWVLTDEPDVTLAKHHGSYALNGRTSAIDAGALQNVSYMLLAKPTGLNKVIKNCNSAGTATTTKASGAYDISCNTRG